MTTTTTGDGAGLRRATGWLLVIGAITFAVAATVLSSTFEWPDILREPPEVVLPAFVDGGTSLVWTWFAVAWTYGLLLAPILLLPAALGRREDPVLRAATFVGAASVLLSLIGFLRWVFVVPPLAASYVGGDPATQAAVAAAWMAQHQFGGALVGEHLGQLLAIAWSVTVSLLVLRTGVLWRWVGWTGLVASGLYLTGQGDILATAVPGFPVWDLGGLLGSTLWGLWVLALGVAVLRAPVHRPSPDPAGEPGTTPARRRQALARHERRSVLEKLPQQPTTKGPAERFTGDVWFDVVAKGEEPSRLRVNTVRFSPGARTAWHAHAVGQTLYVTDGSGLVQSRGGEVVELGPGDVISTPPGEWHWHGAAPDRFMTHLAMWEAPGSGPESEWGGLVTDEEYRLRRRVG